MAGIFGLREVRTEQITKITGNRREYGYFGGGAVPNPSPLPPALVLCTIDRLDFSSETVAAPGISPGQLTQARQILAAVSNSNYGYFGGGFIPPATSVSTIDRLDFSNETVAAPGTYQLTQARRSLATVSNSNYGYFAGGSLPYVCTIDRLDFSNETVTGPPIHGINLTQARNQLAAVSNSNYGYFGGGDTPTSVSTIDRLDFSNETVAAPGTYQLTQARSGLAGVSNSNYGYFVGGEAPPFVNTIDRLDFSNETTSNPPANLTQPREALAGVSNSNYGYFAGGQDGAYQCTIDRLDFSNETVVAPGNNLTEARRYLAGTSGPLKEYTVSPTSWPELSEFGYFGGGFAPPYVSTIDRLDFSNETVGRSTNLKLARQGSAAVSNSNYGYFAGGQPYEDPIDRLDFSNETVGVSFTYQLTQKRNGLAAVSNSNYGYFGGGNAVNFPPNVTCTIERLDFSNETVAAPTGYYLTQNRQYLAAVSSPDYGYFRGGNTTLSPTTYISTIDRLDFSNETVDVPGTLQQLTQARARLATLSNSNYGYFGGGYAPGPTYVCTIDRLDFSNETTSAPGNNLTQARWGLVGVFNSNYGYFGGGANPPLTPDYVSTIDRLDFSNETVSALGNDLTQARGGLAAVSTKPTTETARKVRRGEFDVSGLVYSNYGYFGGGDSPPLAPDYVSTIDRLDFSSETVAAPGAYQLTQARKSLAAVSNSNYGYFGGGESPVRVCTIDRLDFSNETVVGPVTLPPQCTLTQARYGLAAVSNSNYGYFAGGGGPTFPDYSCAIDRLDFSTETVLNPNPGTYQLTDAREGLAAVSNSNYGYFGGGTPTTVSTIDRLDFSTETIEAPGAYQLSQARHYLAAVSNSNYGYFGGGFAPLPFFVCTIDRLDFSNETVAAPGISPGQLTQARNYLAAVSNSNYGYFGGGRGGPSPIFSTIDRLDFSTETVDVPGTLQQLTQEKNDLAGTNIPLNQTRHVAPQAVVGVSTFFFSYGKQENTVSYGFGYFAGGTFPNGRVDTIDRLDFPSETVSAPGNNLTQARYGLAAVSNSNYGYFGGGFVFPGGSIYVCTIDRLDFSNDTVLNPNPGAYQLTQARNALAAVSSPRGYGYFGGGNAPGAVSTIDRLDFSSETVAAPTGYYLTQARYSLAAVSNSNYGYFGGGLNPSNPPSPYCTIDRLDFYDETIAVPGTLPPECVLTQARQQLAAVSNSNYGYFGGGASIGGGSFTCIIDRLDFSSETVTAPTGYYLTQDRQYLAGSSNPNYGYFGGGYKPPNNFSTIDRLDFSNETVVAPSTYQLTLARSQLAGTQVNYYQKVGRPISKDYGYFAGGRIPALVCTIDRLDFSNETTSAPGNNLTRDRYFLAAVSNSNYGYFAGGTAPGNIEVCTIDRLDFSNETVTAPGAYELTQARIGLAGVSNSNYGYFAGGSAPSIPGNTCIIDRLDFSTETVLNPNPGAYQLSQARNSLAAVSNSNYAYFGGGPSPTIVSTIDRLDFFNETVDGPTTLPPQCRLTEARGSLAAVSNSNYGYFAGGWPAPGYACTIDRLDFSSETVTAPGNNLSKGKYGLGAVSNSNYGYFSDGFAPTNVCTIDRLDFSNETVSIPSNNLTQSRFALAAVSN